MARTQLVDTDYHTVAIIGSQSSGKSTLLNALFNTNFDVLDIDQGRNQTTKGIHICPHEETKIVVMDIEGTDSQERGDEGGVFEHMSALYGLAMSDVLLVNMWTVEIGRYKGSAVGLLKTIFEVNLKLFADHQKQKILFVLRDFNHQENVQVLKRQISNSMEQIWSEISKPDSFRLLSVFDCFDFEFAMIASKVQQPDQFTEDIEKLRERFIDQDRGDYLFRNQETDVPIDGFPTYSQSIWERIKSDKDLDIPSQKTLLSILRCKEIKEEVLQRFNNEFNGIAKKATHVKIPEFGSVVSEILKGCMSEFNRRGGRYSKDVVDNTVEELKKQILDQIKDTYNSQVKKVVYLCTTNYKALIKKELSHHQKAIENFHQIVKDAEGQTYQQFSEEVLQLKIEGVDWTITEAMVELENYIKELTRHEQKKQLHFLDVEMKQSFVGKFSQLVGKKLEIGENDQMWIEIAELQKQELSRMKERIKEILKGLNANAGIINQYIVRLNQYCYESIKNKAKKYTSNMVSNLIDKFNEWFLYDKEGKRRDWVGVNLRDLYEQVLQRILCNLDLFKLFKVAQNPQTVLDSAEDLTHIDFQELLDIDEHAKIHEQVIKHAENSYKDAKFLQTHGYSKKGVPGWIWLVMILLSFDDITWIIGSPLVFYPLILIASLLGMAYSTGFGFVPTFIIKQIYSNIRKFL